MQSVGTFIRMVGEGEMADLENDLRLMSQQVSGLKKQLAYANECIANQAKTIKDLSEELESVYLGCRCGVASSLYEKRKKENEKAEKEG